MAAEKSRAGTVAVVIAENTRRMESPRNTRAGTHAAHRPPWGRWRHSTPQSAISQRVRHRDCANPRKALEAASLTVTLGRYTVAAAFARPDGGCSSVGLEHLVVVQRVEGSNPFSRPSLPLWDGMSPRIPPHYCRTGHLSSLQVIGRKSVGFAPHFNHRSPHSGHRSPGVGPRS